MGQKKKTKMGRPKKPAKDKRSTSINVRMTKAERKKIEKDAEEYGLTLGETLMVKAWYRKMPEPKTAEEAARQAGVPVEKVSNVGGIWIIERGGVYKEEEEDE